MIIAVDQIPAEGLDLTYNQETAREETEGLWEPRGPVRATVHLAHRGEQIVASGICSTTVSLVCSRCAEGFPFSVEETFQVVYSPLPVTAPGEEVALSRDDLDVECFDADGIDITHLLRDNIVLALPSQPLCSTGCRGLCPVCGANRNVTPCDCRTQDTDPRLRILATLLSVDPPR